MKKLVKGNVLTFCVFSPAFLNRAELAGGWCVGAERFHTAEGDLYFFADFQAQSFPCFFGDGNFVVRFNFYGWHSGSLAYCTPFSSASFRRNVCRKMCGETVIRSPAGRWALACAATRCRIKNICV